jgi:hypothetical protein
MKKRPSKVKAEKTASSESAASSHVVDAGVKKDATNTARVPPNVAVTDLEFPPFQFLLEQAMGETNRKVLQDYGEVIRVLRDEKGFSFREIGEWLTANGVEADYNDVYRVYTKMMGEMAAVRAAQEDEDDERNAGQG